MNKQQFGNVQIGDTALEHLYKDIIDLSMNQNAGLAMQKIKKNGFDYHRTPTLNNDLNRIMINARREMRKRIQDFFDSHNHPVS